MVIIKRYLKKLMEAVKHGLLYAAVGATVGVGVSIFTRGISKGVTIGWVGGYPNLATDSDAMAICEDLHELRQVSPTAFSDFAKNMDKLIWARQACQDKNAPARISMPSVAQRYKSKAVDAMRKMGGDGCAPAATDALANAQKFMDDIVFNISMDTNARLDS